MSKIIIGIILGCGLLGYAINGGRTAIGAIGGALVAVSVAFLIDRI